MRVAIVADVHGNLTALEAVVADLRRQAPDQVFHGGDLPTSGARPAAVVDRIRELGWQGVCGNTDEMLWNPEPLAGLALRHPQLREMWRVLDEVARHTRDELGEERIRWLQALPRELRRGALALVHASPGDLWTAPPPDAGDAALDETYRSLGAPLAVYAHIHRPFVRTLDAPAGPPIDPDRPSALPAGHSPQVVANTGSVSLSYDGDPRASYLLVDDLNVSIRRVEYDLEREATALLHSRLPRADWLCASLRAARPLPLPEESVRRQP